MPESLPMPQSGLITRTAQSVSLTGVSVEAEIASLGARVTVTQRYVNTEATPIEAVYLFPLDESSAVCAFSAIVDGTLVVGEIKERDEAFKTYDDALQDGHGAFLLDEERPDVFQANVGNLLPGKEVLLKISYVTELSVVGGNLRFAIPTTLSPRYAPPGDRTGIGRPDSEALNAPVEWNVPYGLNISVRIALPGPIGRIESPSHPISVSLDQGRAVVTLSQRDSALDQDFVLTVDAAVFAQPQAWIETHEDDGDNVAIAFVPTLPDRPSPNEVIFVVDRSGSMDGTSIAEVRDALHLCVRSLIDGCYFNIIGFGDEPVPLFSQSRRYDDTSLAEASRHISNLQADLGGTEILKPLELALNQPRHGGLPRELVVITDGQVTNTDEVLALARRHVANTRIFTFGIGAGASHHLVKGLARAGGGAAEFIHPGEQISSKVTRQLRRVLSPAITNVRVDWGGLDVTQVPAVPQALFVDTRLLVYGLPKRPGQRLGAAKVTLLADSSGEPVSFEVDATASPVPGERIVSTLAARSRIRELEEHPESLASRGSRQSDRKVHAVSRESIDLALRYGLMSRETSYVAVERRESAVPGEMQLRRIPVALTRRWGGLERPALSVASLRYTGSYFDLDTRPIQSTLPTRTRYEAQAGPPRSPMFGSAPRVAEKHGGEMFALITLQQANGSWELTEAFAAAVGCSLRQLQSVLTSLSTEPGAPQAWATALALAWLDRHAGSNAGDWRMLAVKAEQWLITSGIEPKGGGSWLDLARAELSGSSSRPRSLLSRLVRLGR